MRRDQSLPLPLRGPCLLTEFKYRAIPAVILGGELVLSSRLGGFDWLCHAISHDGSIISGGLRGPDGIEQASYWTNTSDTIDAPNYSLTLLPTLDGYIHGGANNLSDNGRYLIGGSFSGDWVNGQACYWDISKTVHSLGNLFGSEVSAYSWPTAVSNDNVIVGTIINDAENYQLAFIWDRINGMRYIKDVLQQEYGYDFSGSRLSQAFNISPDGRTINGEGYDALGKSFLWEVTIPEPASALLIGIGGLWLRRRNCR